MHVEQFFETNEGSIESESLAKAGASSTVQQYLRSVRHRSSARSWRFVATLQHDTPAANEVVNPAASTAWSSPSYGSCEPCWAISERWYKPIFDVARSWFSPQNSIWSAVFISQRRGQDDSRSGPSTLAAANLRRAPSTALSHVEHPLRFSPSWLPNCMVAQKSFLPCYNTIDLGPASFESFRML
jgi:hypothetical protein